MGAVALTITACLTLGQVSDSEAKARARAYAIAISQPLEGDVQVIRRDQRVSQVHTYKYVEVSDGLAAVRLDSKGLFTGYIDLKPNTSSSPVGARPVNTEADAWVAFDRIKGAIDASEGQIVRNAERMDARPGPPAQWLVATRPMPNGYPTMGGNEVKASIREQDGRFLLVSVSRGWTFEAPNIKVSKEASLDKGFRGCGRIPE